MAILDAGGTPLDSDTPDTKNVISVKGVRVANADVSSGAVEWLSDHMRLLEAQIVQEAYTIAQADNRKLVAPMDIAKAAERFTPTQSGMPREGTLRSRLSQSISGITLIAAVLAVIFGVLAAYGGKELAAGAWDIAKIFAGAIVGSTGAAAAATRKQ